MQTAIGVPDSNCYRIKKSTKMNYLEKGCNCKSSYLLLKTHPVPWMVSGIQMILLEVPYVRDL